MSIRGPTEYTYAGYTLKPETSLRELDLGVVERLTNQHSSIMKNIHPESDAVKESLKLSLLVIFGLQERQIEE